MISLPLQTAPFGTAVRKLAFKPERRISQIKLSGERIIGRLRDPCGKDIAPVATAIPRGHPRYNSKNLPDCDVSTPCSSGLVLFEAVENRLVSRGRSAARPQDPSCCVTMACGHAITGSRVCPFLAHPCEEVEAVFGTRLISSKTASGSRCKNLVTGLRSLPQTRLRSLHFEPVAEELALSWCLHERMQCSSVLQRRGGYYASSCLIKAPAGILLPENDSHAP